MVAEPLQYSSDFGHSFKMKINEISLYFNKLGFHLSILPKSNYLPLCCYTGLSFIDIKQLTAEHIVKDREGNFWIRKARQKTKNMCNIPLLEIPLAIIKKYKDNPKCQKQNVLLPVPCNQKMNSYLKEISDLCGIHKEISTHTARHSYATSVCLANGVSIENVAKMLGHSNISMTKRYARVLDQSILNDMQKVGNLSTT